MTTRRKQGLLEGALTLTISIAIVKIIGAFFKIPLANIIGGLGMSYFSAAYDIFIPIYGIISSGLGVALARLIAETHAKHNTADELIIVSSARRFFLAVGIICSVMLYFLARPISVLVGNPAAYMAVLAIIPAIPLSCMSSVYRGYFQGAGDMKPTAVSQVIEAASKLILGLGLAGIVRSVLKNEFMQLGTVANIPVNTPAEAEGYMLRYTAAAAVLGISISTAFGAYYVYRRYRLTTSALPPTTNARQRSYTRTIIAVALPISISTLITSLSGLIDLGTVMNCLHTAINADEGTVRSSIQGIDLSFISSEQLPEYLYGSYAGLAHSVAMLIPSLVGVLSVCTIPNVSSAYCSKNHREVEKLCTTILRITLFLAMPMGIVLFLKAPDILELLYPLRAAERAIAAPVLSIMGITAIFISVASSLAAILQSIHKEKLPLLFMIVGAIIKAVLAPVLSIMGITAIFISVASSLAAILQSIHKEKLPLLFMIVGAIIKAVLNLTLVKIPAININGVPYGSLVCYIAVALIELAVLRDLFGGMGRALLIAVKSLFASVLSVAVANAVSGNLHSNSLIYILIFFVIFSLVYIISSIILGSLHKNDLMFIKTN